MKYEFTSTHKKEYTIVRDYYVSNNHLQGIYFILYDEVTKELITRFLKKDIISNENTWSRKSVFNSMQYQLRVEKGNENKLVVERGLLTIKKENFIGNPVEKKHKAERIIFNLRNPNR